MLKNIVMYVCIGEEDIEVACSSSRRRPVICYKAEILKLEALHPCQYIQLTRQFYVGTN
jgi:hypothetical protein